MWLLSNHRVIVLVPHDLCTYLFSFYYIPCCVSHRVCFIMRTYWLLFYIFFNISTCSWWQPFSFYICVLFRVVAICCCIRVLARLYIIYDSLLPCHKLSRSRSGLSHGIAGVYVYLIVWSELMILSQHIYNNTVIKQTDCGILLHSFVIFFLFFLLLHLSSWTTAVHLMSP